MLRVRVGFLVELKINIARPSDRVGFMVELKDNISKRYWPGGILGAIEDQHLQGPVIGWDSWWN